MSEQTIDTELKNRQQEFYQCLMKLLDDDVKELILKNNTPENRVRLNNVIRALYATKPLKLSEQEVDAIGIYIGDLG